MYFDLAANEFKEIDRDPAKLAFGCADRELTWQQLKDLSDKICSLLEQTNIPEGAPVIIYGEKETLFIAAILACYRKKLPFIPIEPSLPAKRIENIILQSGAQLGILCGNSSDAPQLSISINSDLEIVGQSTFETVHPDSAYILFTSGSSGEPKGVIVTRENLISFASWFCKNFPVSHETEFINQASLLFDISLADVFGTLHTGGSAVFNSSSQVASGDFFSRIQKGRGNYWNSTPSFLSFCFTNKEFTEKHFSAVKTFVLSGENLSPALVRELFVRFPSAKVFNAYGPTEACIFSSCILITPEMLSAASLPISEFPQECLSIENGELIISGPQVTQGYLGGKTFNGRFATGDLVEEKDGLLFYKGRKDDQVKLNGYRIELNEIKHVLELHTNVAKAECLPVVVNHKVKRLIAFVTVKNNQPDLVDIKKHLALLLPAYMIPSEIIPIKEFPHTSSFKTDRKKLLETYLNF
jgi:D-alanine--poly(phosphoribitol) ligase subunit 1